MWVTWCFSWGLATQLVWMSLQCKGVRGLRTLTWKLASKKKKQKFPVLLSLGLRNPGTQHITSSMFYWSKQVTRLPKCKREEKCILPSMEEWRVLIGKENIGGHLWRWSSVPSLLDSGGGWDVRS